MKNLFLLPDSPVKKTKILMTSVRAILFALVIVSFNVSAVKAIENDECLLCHEDDTFTTKFGRSVHSDFTCDTCHASLAESELPHDTPVAPVDCGGCHDKAQAQFSRQFTR